MRAFADKTTMPHARRRAAALVALATLVAGIAGASLVGTSSAQGGGPHNVIFVFTDDQTHYEMTALPTVRREIGAKGATFERAYIPYPLCCPARVTVLSGKNMHNHQVRGNGGPYGGWPRFEAQEAEALPPRMQGAGYHTVHIGKYMNGYYPPPAIFPHVPPGWSEWYGKVAETNLYYDYTLVESNGVVPPHYVPYGSEESDYQTDVLKQKALDFIDGLPSGGGGPKTPFALHLWPNAPHAPFIPAPRHLHQYGGTKLPRLPGFNERDIRDKPKWLRIQARKRLGPRIRTRIARERRRRLEMLISVDEAVGEMIDALEAKGILEDTYIIFTSDNGYFRGEHRIAGGKYLPHEPSSRVPLLIRGPGIPAGVRSRELVSLLDVSQTILELTTGSTDPALDGRSLLPFAKDPKLRTRRPILLEADTGPGQGGAGFDPASAQARAGLAGAKGVSNLEQDVGVPRSVRMAAANGNFAPAYRALRTNRYLLVLYANGQRELYDMALDPGQLRNLARSPRYRKVRRWLFNRLLERIRCEGVECRRQIARDPRPLPRRKPKRRR